MNFFRNQTNYQEFAWFSPGAGGCFATLILTFELFELNKKFIFGNFYTFKVLKSQQVIDNL